MLPHLNLAVVLLAYAAAPAVTQPLPLVSENTLASAQYLENVGEVLAAMRELAEGGMTSIVVTHELSFARRAANEVVFLNHGLVAHHAPSANFFSRAVPDRAGRFLSRMEV